MAQCADIPHEGFLFVSPKSSGVLILGKFCQNHGKMTFWRQSEFDPIGLRFVEPHNLLQALFQAFCSFFAFQT